MELRTLGNRVRSWLAAGVRLVVLESWDEDVIEEAAWIVSTALAAELWRWTVVSGLTRDSETIPGQLTREPDTMLYKVLGMSGGVVLAEDLAAYYGVPTVVRALRQISRRRDPVLLLLGQIPGVGYPPELMASSLVVSLEESATAGSTRLQRRWLTSSDDALREAVTHTRMRSPGLSPITTTGGFDTVGGLAQFKAWVARRKMAQDLARGLPYPRGALLLGLQGTGKSLSVKAWAHDWGWPLYRLDMGAILGRFVGQSEAQFAEALRAIESAAPAMLWIDEIDKVFGVDVEGHEHDGGTMARLAGMWLTWMEERRESVIVVATANEVEHVPPELLRPGRFDALFFVDLPDARDRREILALHLVREGLAATEEMLRVAEALEDFSGADIRALVTEARFLAAEAGEPLTAEILKRAASEMIPWATTMPEEVARRREWARGRLRWA